MDDSNISSTGDSSNSLPRSQSQRSAHQKLPRLPTNHKVQKRPLLHPPISSPYSSSTTSPKVIYVSASTPFITIVKRIRKYLSAIENRSSSKSSKPGRRTNRTEELRRLMNNANDAGFLKGVEDSVKAMGKGDGRREGEEVILKATGKAIEKLLGVVVWLDGEEEFDVVIRTGSVGAVDDVAVVGGEDEGEEEVESRIRRISCLEAGVRLKGV